ncbi:MAG: polysaccharide deacetylase family protein [Cyanobacteriota bacterium]|nr:polysaccharide deacetylase family protein [Cyanobacteriota bacterium]
MLSFSQNLTAFIAQAFPDAIFYQLTQERIVALTIDDVGDKSTELILDAIDQYNQKVTTSEQQAKATFFLNTGLLMGSQETVIKILEKNHEIGNHGVFDRTHADLEPEEFEEELWQAHKELTENTGVKVKWFRPGRGRYNLTMLKSLHKISETEGYHPQFALASMIPLDTFTLTGHPLFTSNYISRFVFPGSILVLHGGSMKRTKNLVLCLEDILQDLNKKGYRIVTLSELMAQSQFEQGQSNSH